MLNIRLPRCIAFLLTSSFFLSIEGYSVVTKKAGRYQVVGTIEAGEQGIAVLFDEKTQKTKAFKQGERISKDLRIKSVDRKVVTVESIESENEFALLKREVDSRSDDTASSATSINSNEDAEPVVTVIDAWGRQTEVTLEEYLAADDEEGDDYTVQDTKKKTGLEEKYKSLFPTFLGTTGKLTPSLVKNKLSLPKVPGVSDVSFPEDGEIETMDDELEREELTKEMVDFYRELEELDESLQGYDGYVE